MRAEGKDTRSIRVVYPADGAPAPEIIDQTRLPHELHLVRLHTVDEAARAISSMQVRGAPLIGVTAAYGVALAVRADPTDEALVAACAKLLATRPTAVNLRWALDQMRRWLLEVEPDGREDSAFIRAGQLAEADVDICRGIGEHGSVILRQAAAAGSGRPLQVLTHCNAGWLATVDWGTALAPVYRSCREGLAVHVWVSETRPRNQGASLTAWELLQEGIPHTIVADSACGHLLRTGQVDLVITGTDRTTAAGDVCNKIGTYLKASAARDCGVPFYVAVPGPSIDWQLGEGESDRIPIEERDEAEVSHVRGLGPDGRMVDVQVTPAGSPVANPGFDVTPARLLTGLITESGLCEASPEGLRSLYPNQNRYR